MTQYVRCQFKPGTPSYTYSWDGESLNPGDYVRVPGRTGGLTLARVLEVSDTQPSFPTKQTAARA